MFVGSILGAVAGEAAIPQAWKDKYIDQFIPINGAFGGSVWPTLSLTSLDPNYNWYYMVPAPIMRSVVSNWGSMNSLVPDPRVYGDRPIVTTMDGKTYGANDFAELLLAANNTIASKTYADTSKYTGTLAPGVRTHCISGYGIPTLSHIQFSDSNFSENKLIQDADGDGTVATESAAVCPGWKNMQKEEVTSDEVKGLFHVDGPKNKVVISHVLRYLGLPYLPEQ
jgi:lysophospholipase-3